MFSAENSATACGIWSTTYAIALLITLAAVGAAMYFSRGISQRRVKFLLICFSIFTISTEIIKMIFTGVTYGIGEVEFVPLYFCSLFMYSTVFSVLDNQWLRNTGLSFLFFGGIIGAVAFFIYPSACIPNYPIYHFMCLRTMIFHGMMIYTGYIVVKSGYYKPDIRHFRNYFVAMLAVSIGAYVHNTILGTNLMYISEPLDIELSRIVYNMSPALYPFLFMGAQIIVPFFISFGAYAAVKAIYIKNKFKNENKEKMNV